MDKSKAWIIDIETYPNCFLFAVVRADETYRKVFEVSDRKNEINRVFACLDYLNENNHYMVSFNGIGFDYPILHKLYVTQSSLPKTGTALAKRVYNLAQEQIDSFKDNGFGNTIKSEDVIVKQLDLYKIWHFNNKAKATSLKLLEFNMRMDNIEDLPFEIGQTLTSDEIDKLIEYNLHDITATLRFFNESQSQIDFRLSMSEKYGKDWNNFDDTKIGAEYFQMKLQEAGAKLKVYKDGKQVINQTKRNKISVKECLFDYYRFAQPEFQAVYNWFSKQTITETKGVFSDIEEHNLGELSKYAETTTKRKKFKNKPTDTELAEFKREHPMGWVEEEELQATEWVFDSEGNHVMEQPLLPDGSPNLMKKPKKKRQQKKSYWGCWKIAETLNTTINGYRIDFGVGGVHASLSEKIAKETSTYIIRDADVSSMYPNIAIANRIYPEHLGETFCDIYKDMYEQRKSFPKGSAENGMLKLALNGTYGKSNDKYSVFYDPKFTMMITINGQLSLLMLADRLLQINGLKLIQLNTDGITVAMRRETEEEYKEVCKQWERDVGLELEFVDYSKMIIRDVNNYIAVYTNGKTKRKGAYQYEGLGWHQNQSALVIPMAAEAHMLTGVDLREFITEHFNKGNTFDFLLRTKVDRSSRLILVYDDGTEKPQQRVCRYYPSNSGGKLVKIMKPLEGKEADGERRLSLDAAWLVKTCNNLKDFDGDINFDYYVEEAKKLVIQ